MKASFAILVAMAIAVAFIISLSGKKPAFIGERHGVFSAGTAVGWGEEAVADDREWNQAIEINTKGRVRLIPMFPVEPGDKHCSIHKRVFVSGRTFRVFLPAKDAGVWSPPTEAPGSPWVCPKEQSLASCEDYFFREVYNRFCADPE